MIQLSAYKELNPDGATPSVDLQLTVNPGERLGIMGHSGAGKTTLLKILAGLIKPDHGQLYINGKPWMDTEKGIYLPPQKRNIGFVFQEYALFPNMTVQQNLEFAFSDRINQSRLRAIIEMLGIASVSSQKPATLSGGQKQRVALGRALIRDPDLLLLDEPLSALDPAMRGQLQKDLKRITSQFDGTIVLVSHNPIELIELTDRAIILENGTITADGRPSQLLSRGASAKAGAAKIIDILPQEEVLIARSAHGLIHIPYCPFEHADLDVGDQVTLSAKNIEIKKEGNLSI
ncbi:ATP-binding cassette domain-containing protein [Fodinibius salsisoli]|uniref:ATP-binding cassette domain-containing protein n=1 Tax=Fodinibius salsisoli TaxID=2820877 RepID=A0ABT3PTI1_9BACT|nr:ATP-binding cassette domain-containing protein [Fodinibius salsisoli]MCW9709165.1 ATP-binding cassette domain-containing protein [Fodinibius salsisoli]